MSSVVAIDAKRMDLIKRTVAKDCNAAEFDWFMHICRHTKLDPLRRQIYAFVFHANDNKKRQMVPVVAIGGLRSIAARTGSYRPDTQAARIDLCEANQDTNPSGLLRAEVTVFKHSHGEWFPVVGEAYWDEFAPIVDEWKEGEDGRRGKTGKRSLDKKKDGWIRMPRLMLAKCAEAMALRKAWPDDFGDLYEESEIDRAQVLDLTPSELAETAAQEQRFEVIGGRNALTVDWCNGAPLERIPSGQFGDRAIEFIGKHADQPLTIMAWRDRNRITLKEYWAIDKAGAFALKQALEPVEASFPANPAQQAVMAAK